ncbi:MAG: hypothetical protein M3Q61_05870 [Chloroflexota bacterium]|nr:hypothetical protein [Chloroflexota bacterium]
MPTILQIATLIHTARERQFTYGEKERIASTALLAAATACGIAEPATLYPLRHVLEAADTDEERKVVSDAMDEIVRKASAALANGIDSALDELRAAARKAEDAAMSAPVPEPEPYVIGPIPGQPDEVAA